MLVTAVNPATASELIKLLFGLWTQRNYVLDWSADWRHLANTIE